MDVQYTLPPNFQAIVDRFGPPVTKPGVLFTYGNVIYYPGGRRRGPISDAIMAHEAVHARRQGDDPAGWWQRYLTEKSFRYTEELVAHQVEYLVASEGVGRQIRRRALALIAHRLSSPLYGRMVTLDQAREAIKGECVGL